MDTTPNSPDSTTAALPADAVRRAARNVTVLVGASIISKGILFIWQIVLGNWLGPQLYGIYGTVLALLAIAAPITSFGMGLIAIREIARAPASAGRYWTAMLFAQTGLFLLAYPGALLIGALSDYSGTLLAYAAIAGLSLLIDQLGSQANDLLLAQERMHVTSVVDITHTILRISVVALALTGGFGLMGLYIITLLTGVLRAGVLWAILWHGGTRPEFPLDRALLRQLFIFSAPLAIGAVITLIYQHTDKLMTTAILGETSTGLLQPAFVISAGIIELLSTTVLIAIYPLLSRYHGQGDTFGYLVEKLARFMLMVGLPIGLILTFFPAAILDLIYSADYAPTAGILRIFVWFTVLTLIANVFSKALLIQNRQRLLVLIQVGGLLLNMSLNLYLLVTYRDPRGAALASVAAEALTLGLMLVIFRAQGYALERLLPGTLRVLAVGVAAAAVMIGLGSLHFLIGIAGGLLAYAAMILLLPVLSREDWDLLYRLMAALPGGSVIRRFWRRKVAVRW